MKKTLHCLCVLSLVDPEVILWWWWNWPRQATGLLYIYIDQFVSGHSANCNCLDKVDLLVYPSPQESSPLRWVLFRAKYELPRSHWAAWPIACASNFIPTTFTPQVYHLDWQQTKRFAVWKVSVCNGWITIYVYATPFTLSPLFHFSCTFTFSFYILNFIPPPPPLTWLGLALQSSV